MWRKSPVTLLSRNWFQDAITQSKFGALRMLHLRSSDARILAMLCYNVGTRVEVLAAFVVKRTVLAMLLSGNPFAKRPVIDASVLATILVHYPAMMVRTAAHANYPVRFIVPIRSVHRSVRNRVVQVLSAANGLAIIKGDVHLPCAVPCSRTKRCPEALICGHQCPSLCGEICPEGYCHVFSTKQDNRVDLLEMKSHNEIDLDESPIVVLGCGYFLTAETLDGMIGMAEVYDIDNCNCAIRQHTTQRYNRVISRAVIDEVPKRFLVSGQECIWDLNSKIEDLDQEQSPASAKNHAAREAAALEGQMAGLTIDPGTPTNDHRVTVGGFAADLKSQSIILPNLSTVVQALRSNPAGSSFKIPGGNPAQHHTSFLRDCKTIIQDCTHANLPKLAVDNTLGLLGKEWNKEVTAEELAAIKQAMFVIGECGMPMEQDRCPECGAMIGGQHHRVVDGVTRATEME
ncbi:hypothetical protein BKA61DRAFT_569718 [Leptodontidium sp. MPI-SDFR-AT-0119]|nr:hypothetical protein BKA61DRAFT_569718 [Leptodontidium sp. MPI-SDFR-AT-0119]